MSRSTPILLIIASFIFGSIVCSQVIVNQDVTAAVTMPDSEAHDTTSGDWSQWGGSPTRNNVPPSVILPDDWDVGGFDRKTHAWKKDESRNIKWVAPLGSQSYGNAVVAGGRVFIGTNNKNGYLARYPNDIDLGCLLAFRESDGTFLWQHSSEKLSTGRVHDWPLQGICCAPLVEGDRLWYVTSRGEVACLDTQGYYDNEDDGPEKAPRSSLFRVAPLATSGLDAGQISPALAAVFAANGHELAERARVENIAEGEHWRISQRVDRQKQFFDVVLLDGQVTLNDQGIGKEPSDSTLITQFADQLTEGLDDGQLTLGLTHLLAKRGMPFDPKVTITQEKTGWKLVGTVDGGTREAYISKRGPYLIGQSQITIADQHEADTVWVYNMMKQLDVSQHNMCSCSVTALGDILFVNTSNGVDESHRNIPSLEAPSFIALDKNTGEFLWGDSSPGANILHGQWSSPAVGTIEGVDQVIFAGGDGWVYSFQADRGTDGKPKLLWKFDANPKTSEWILGGRGTRNNIIATPVIYDNKVYVAVGQDPEHGPGDGHLWCIDPTKHGDVSPQLAVHVDDRTKPLPPRRLQAVDEEAGEVAVDNPNSAVIWHYSQHDQNGDGELESHEAMHRSCGTVAIKDDILYIADFSGIFHCLNAQTGEVHWTYDMFSPAWGSPLIADDRVFIGDEDGEIAIFRHSSEPQEPIAEIDMRTSVFSTPVVANDVLYISNRSHLFAIEEE